MTIRDVQANSMPLPDAEYPPPPYHLGPLRGLNFLCPLAEDMATSLVPKPLVPSQPSALWIYSFEIEFGDPRCKAYHEVGFYIPVMHDAQPGLFALALYLDHSLPITIGREVWGFPKKIADAIELSGGGESRSTRLVQSGKSTLQATCQFDSAVLSTTESKPSRICTRRMIPGWKANEPALDQLVELQWRADDEQRSIASETELSIGFPPNSALSILNGLASSQAWYSETKSCELTGGQVVWDYLRT